MSGGEKSILKEKWLIEIDDLLLKNRNMLKD